MQLGKTQSLTITENIGAGFILTDESGEKAFMSKIFALDNMDIGEQIEVFVFQDEDAIKATTELPLCEVDEYAVMTCVQSMAGGAFMDWGIIKDLFIPYKLQKGKMLEGKRYIVYVYVDEITGRLTGTTKFKRNPQYFDLSYKIGDKVQLTMMGESEIGWNVVIDKKYIGLIYTSDVYKKLYPLSSEVGYIKTIREDGKLDVTLQPDGFENIDEYRQIVLDRLESNSGLIYLSDKSSPEDIKYELQMSKKNFKKAIGGLYKDKMIEILDDKIRLL